MLAESARPKKTLMDEWILHFTTDRIHRGDTTLLIMVWVLLLLGLLQELYWHGHQACQRPKPCEEEHSKQNDAGRCGKYPDCGRVGDLPVMHDGPAAADQQLALHQGPANGHAKIKGCIDAEEVAGAP